MENRKLHLTRRIQLLIDHPVPEERKDMLDKLYRFQNRCFRAANLIVSHLYVQEMIKDFFYLSEGIQYKLADEKKEQEGILQRSRLNSTNRLVCDIFKGEVPTDILGSLNNTLHSTFSKNKLEYAQGIRSLRNFKRDIPIPFIPRNLSGFVYNAEKKAFTFRLFSIPFKTYLGKDFSDKKKLLTDFSEGKMKLCTSQIQLKRNKIYWLVVFEMEREEHILKPEIIAEASLSLEHPIVVKTPKAKLTIGTKEEFLYRRLAIQAARKRLEEGVSFSRGGKGIQRKRKALVQLGDKESRYVSHHLHLYSRKLVDFCIQQHAGTLVLVQQEDKIGIAKEEEFVLRNWSYYELQTKIRYKAEKAGIELIIA